MKKALYAILVVLVVSFLHQDVKSQTITAHSFTDSCGLSSQQGNYVQFSALLSAASPNHAVKCYWGDGTVTTTTTTSLSVFTVHYYTTPGTFSYKFVLLNNNVPKDSVMGTYNGDCIRIPIRIWKDDNSDCIRQSSEPYLTAFAKVKVDSANIPIDTLNISGYGDYIGALNKTYKFTLLSGPIGTNVVCPSTGSITITTPSSYSVSMPPVNFGLNCGASTAYDLGVRYSGFFRPVNASSIYIWPYNSSCGNQNATVTLQLNPKYLYSTASPAPASISGNTITWNLSNLSAFGNQTPYIYIGLVPDTVNYTINLGDTICNSITISPTSGDIDISNNIDSHCDSVKAAFDPNDKSVSPSGNIASGTLLTYHINFENLGNDTAFNIHILDTLSQHLDASTLQVIQASHPMRTTMLTTTGNQALARFDFPNIRLADKNHPAANKGYVRFTVRVKNNLAPGTEIPNRAGIFFDVNPVVLTNYAYSRTAVPQSVNDLTQTTSLEVFPNPTREQITIRQSGDAYTQAKLTNSLGQLILTRKLNGHESIVNIQSLTTGIYFLELSGKNGTHVEKIVKQ